MATLAANDQENAVRHLHAGANGKAFNAGMKAFGAKTPGNKAPKTPFKIPLNDENAAGKTIGKGKGNLLMTGAKGGKLDENAFVTPAGPRTRAPLGMKTTNAKSRAFQTPAPLSASGKTQKVSPRLRRPKVKVHQPEAEEAEDDVPEVEYMPPKEAPLSDDMDDYIPRDWTIPKISHEAMVRGITQAYRNPIEDDGRTREQRRFEEEVQRERKQRDKEWDRLFEAEMAKDDAEMRRYMGVSPAPTNVLKPKATANVPPKRIGAGISTIRAKSAAAALSPPSKRTYTAPTAAAKSRLPTGFVSSKKTVKPLAQAIAPRQAAAVTASKSTIGYAQGRAGRAAPTARKPLSNVTRPALSSTRGPISRCSSTSTNATLVTPPQEEETYRTAEDIEREMELLFLSRSDDEGEEAWSNSFGSQLHAVDPLDEELEDFQFQLPDGI